VIQALLERMQQQQQVMLRIVKETEQRIVAMKREVESVEATDSLQKAQRAIASSHAGVNSRLGSAMSSLERIRDRQEQMAARLGSGPITDTVEASKWRSYRAEWPAGKAGCLSKSNWVREGSHLDVPQGFDQNGPTLRRKAWKYRHIPAPFLLALNHFASNLNGASNGA